MNRISGNIPFQLKKWLKIFVLIAIPLELLFFWSSENLAGSIMTIICLLVFSKFLNSKYILTSPFAFLMYLSMFLYRFLPLFSTLLEGNPISLGFEKPFKTFFFESLLFLISSAAFFFAAKNSLNMRNNPIQKVLYHIGFFKIDIISIWVLGAIGFIVRLYTFSQGNAEYGDVGGKFVDGLKYLLYAPSVLLFAGLTGLPNYSKKKLVWIYLSVVFMINIASNSRAALITPIAIFLLLLFLNLIKNNIGFEKIFSPGKLLIIILFIVFGLEMLSDFSLAMLYNRNLRGDISRSELFERTIETYKNEDLISKLKNQRDSNEDMSVNYQDGWTETYIDNFMLNRYANLRITDQTLYYADLKGYGDSEMLEDFKKQLLFMIPTPVLSLIGVQIDKSDNKYSRGDLLSGSGLGSYKVTSHVGDGLVTFGFWYFLIQFLANFIVFSLLNSLIFFTRNGVIYSAFGLMSVFTYLGMFRNSNGILIDISFIFRGFWQGIFTYLFVLILIRFFVNLFKKS